MIKLEGQQDSGPGTAMLSTWGKSTIATFQEFSYNVLGSNYKDLTPEQREYQRYLEMKD